MHFRHLEEFGCKVETVVLLPKSSIILPINLDTNYLSEVLLERSQAEKHEEPKGGITYNKGTNWIWMFPDRMHYVKSYNLPKKDSALKKHTISEQEHGLSEDKEITWAGAH